MKNKCCRVLIVSIFLNCGVADVDVDAKPLVPAFEQKIMTYEKELTEMATRKEGIIENQVVRDVFSVFSEGKVASGRRNLLITGLSIIGLGTNGFINEPLIVELLVCALSDDERRLRESAFNRLMKDTEWRLLPPFKSDILKADAKHNFSDIVNLLCLLNLTETEKTQWLESTKVYSLAQRAALGDLKSEDSLIILFEKVKTFGEIEDRAADLAFIGSQKSRIALIKGLETDIIKVLPPDYVISVSGISAVIKELSRLHPDEPLLTSEFRNVNKPIFTETGIIDDPKVKDYLMRLAKWTESTYGVKLNFPRETSFIRTKNDISGARLTPP